MKTFTARISFFLLGLALVAGCQSGASGNSTSAKPASIVILFGKPPKPYFVVGTVSALKNQPIPGDTWQNALQKEAASRGADAILVDSTTLDDSKTVSVTGTAIRYQ